jgi:hypothetical protein
MEQLIQEEKDLARLDLLLIGAKEKFRSLKRRKKIINILNQKQRFRT